jgi:hypothetical protein
MVEPRVSHEEGFVRAFIVPDKQERYLALLSSRKRRHGFLDRLNHNTDYDAQFASHVPSSEQSASAIERLLRLRGAPDICHTISSHAGWDDRDLPLREALDLIVGFGMGSVLSCIPGRLAYYEAEDLGARYIFSR